MSYQLDRDTMIITFKMGSDCTDFTHNTAQKFKLFPFLTTGEAIVSLNNVLGEWLRIANLEIAIYESADEVIGKMIELVDVENEHLASFSSIIKSIFWTSSGTLKPININFMKYIPCEKNEAKIAEYLYSVLGSDDIKTIIEDATKETELQADVLTKALMSVLESGERRSLPISQYFQITTVAQKIFNDDLKFIVANSLRTKEHLPELLEFYYFFYTSQVCLMLDQFDQGNRTQPIPLFFSLDWEKTSKARKCYNQGWSILERSINNMFYHAITLEILNQTNSVRQYDYIAINDLINQDTEIDIANQIKGVTDIYRSIMISKMNDVQKVEYEALEKHIEHGIVFSEILYLYESVKNQFKRDNSPSERYSRKFRMFCYEHFLKHRGQSGMMLNITEEKLIFLTKLVIKDNDQMSLNDVFEQFEKRGIYFDSSSKEEIIKFYSKLNLIDKKSDSGDAQYVKRFL